MFQKENDDQCDLKIVISRFTKLGLGFHLLPHFLTRLLFNSIPVYFLLFSRTKKEKKREESEFLKIEMCFQHLFKSL